MINNLPTIFEVVTGAAKKQTKEKGPNPNSMNKSNKPNTKMVSDSFFHASLQHKTSLVTLYFVAIKARVPFKGPKDGSAPEG